MNRPAYICIVALSFLYMPGMPMASAQVSVSTAMELRVAFEAADAGTTIEVSAGTYEVDGNLTTQRAGREGAPIIVRGPETGEALIRFSRSDGGYVEGFKVQHAWWVFEGLTLEGSCADHSRCEHAWHISGDADRVVIRNNIARNFNAHIKANRSAADGMSVFPDDVLIEGNEFYSETIRATSNPVTPIDVVGGRRWVIRANFIHDHAKGEGNGISYAAFLKGNSRDGIIEGNLVICELLHTGQTRLGLSFGGGGSGPPEICEDGTCSPEHQDGVMRNNIVVNCPVDVGVFVRECDDCAVLHNTLYNNRGIDYIENSTGEVSGNIMSGDISDRQGSTTTRGMNLENVSDADFAAWFTEPSMADFTLRGDGATFVDQGGSVAEVRDDFCRNDRTDGAHDLGAVEYDGDGPCGTTTPFTGVIVNPMPDAGPGLPDAGSEPVPEAGVDAGIDSGSTPDSGPGEGGRDDGCGCVAAGAPGATAVSGVASWILLGCALWWRRRLRS